MAGSDMKVGDLIRIKSPAFYAVGAYHAQLFDEIMLVTDIIDDFAAPDSPISSGSAIDCVVECTSISGVHRFPIEDMEVLPSVIDHEIEMMALALADS